MRMSGIALGAMGILLIFLANFAPDLAPDLAMKLEVMAAGVGVTSLGVAFLSAWIARMSDAKMMAIANLEFDEKAAMLEKHESYFKQRFDMTQFEIFRWDMEAIAHVAKWAAKGKRERVSTSIDAIAASVAANITKDSLDRLRQPSSTIRGSVN